VKRYQLDYHHTQTYAEMVEDCDGDWVKYNDYKAASDRIEELETQLSEARQVGKEWFEEQKKARKDANAAEAKLAEVVETLRVIEDASGLYASDRESDIENVRYAHECTRRLCVATIAELNS
jgi:hypothetical protein